jgi:hypothetical protein
LAAALVAPPQEPSDSRRDILVRPLRDLCIERTEVLRIALRALDGSIPDGHHHAAAELPAVATAAAQRHRDLVLRAGRTGRCSVGRASSRTIAASPLTDVGSAASASRSCASGSVSSSEHAGPSSTEFASTVMNSSSVRFAGRRPPSVAEAPFLNAQAPLAEPLGVIEVVRRAEDGTLTCADARIADGSELPF